MTFDSLFSTVAVAALALMLTGCDEYRTQPGQDFESTPRAGKSSPDADKKFVVDLAFDDAMVKLDSAARNVDADFLREQWKLVDLSANLDMSVASSNRLAVTTRLAELVQKYVPELEHEALAYLLELSKSRFPSHREFSARAMRESSGEEAVSALFARAVDSDRIVSSAALESLRWKVESAGMSDATDTATSDAQLIERNISALCADARLPRQNVDLCAAVTQPRR
jgi:hypothetical protein